MCFSKLFEYVAIVRMEKHNLLSQFQHGFKVGELTVTALLKVYKCVLCRMDPIYYPVVVLYL